MYFFYKFTQNTLKEWRLIMKNFFKFKPSKPKNDFRISDDTFTPTLSKEKDINSALKENVEFLQKIFHYPISNDIQFRYFDININENKYNALLIFYDGMVDSNLINGHLIKQLMKKYNSSNEQNSVLKQKNVLNIKDIISGEMLSESQVTFAEKYDDLVTSVLHGDAALLVDTLNIAIICDVKKPPSRSVSKAENEMNIDGPSEAFIESFRTNTALIRKFVKDENLIFETLEVGSQSKTKCAVAYISTITNESIINEVKRRINSIDIDYLLDSGELMQLIEDKTYLIDPLILSTERPDKVASHLMEGRVAIIVEGSSNVLVVPAVFSDFTHSSEDSYIRFPYSLLIRLFRFPAIFFSIFLPGLYIAICNFHQEMIPTDLLFTIERHKRKSSFFYDD
jgi:spore germination protein KA